MKLRPNPYEGDSSVYAMENLAWEMFEQGRTPECSNILEGLGCTSVDSWFDCLDIAIKNELDDRRAAVRRDDRVRVRRPPCRR